MTGITADNWKTWAKPWTIEQCKEYYLCNSEIVLREVSRISGISESLLLTVSAKEKWTDEKIRTQQAQERAIGQTMIAVIDQNDPYAIDEKKGVHPRYKQIARYITADQKLQKRIKSHLNNWETTRNLAYRYLQYVQMHLQAIETNSKVAPEYTDALNFMRAEGGNNAMQTYVSMIKVATEMERTTLNMDLHDPNQLAKIADKLGYALIKRDDSTVLEPINDENIGSLPLPVDVDLQDLDQHQSGHT